MEKQIGTALPADYKALIGLYGSGGFNQELLILNPFDARDHFSLARRIGVDAGGYDFCPHPIFPAAGGLLPLGWDRRGRELRWLTRGEPDAWTVVAISPRGAWHAEFDLGLGAFLDTWFSGKLKCSGKASQWTPLDEYFGWDGGDDVKARGYFIPEPEGERRARVEAQLSPADLAYPKRLAALKKILESIAGGRGAGGPLRHRRVLGSRLRRKDGRRFEGQPGGAGEAC